MKLSQIGQLHRRRVYALFDLLGDLGGVLELIVLFFGVLVAPVSYYSFIMKAAEKLFYGRTKDANIFDYRKDMKIEKFIEGDVLTFRE